MHSYWIKLAAAVIEAALPCSGFVNDNVQTVITVDLYFQTVDLYFQTVDLYFQTVDLYRVFTTPGSYISLL